jgi:hypothetical protein
MSAIESRRRVDSLKKGIKAFRFVHQRWERGLEPGVPKANRFSEAGRLVQAGKLRKEYSV